MSEVILSLDSSDKALSVGLMVDGEIKETKTIEAWQRQSEFLVDEIAKLLDAHSISRTAISAVSTCIGPGSYTGVRIALTIAKTICLALQIPLYLSSSLESLAKPGCKSLCVCNARGKRSYVGIYEDGKCLRKDCIMENSELLSLIDSDPSLTLCGDCTYLGSQGYRADVAENLLLHLDEDHLCDNPMGAKPVYLKDDYEKDKFKVTIRRTLPSDLDAIMAIEEKSFKHPYSREQMLYELNENPVGYLYSALVDAEVVGFIDFMITFNSATISQIAVKEEMRGKGIGNMLIGQLLKDCRAQKDPVEYLTLEVRKSNERAIRFYKRHCFEEILTKKGYYDDGEDAVYMVRSIING